MTPCATNEILVRSAGAGALLSAAETFLAGRGVPSPRHDAERLLAHVLSVPHLELRLEPERRITEGERARFARLLGRRGEREPLQHIEGTVEFFSRTFRIRRPILIPRPETEILAEAAEPHLEPPVLDVGTGSGCLLLALLARTPRLHGEGWDVSEGAITLARENAARLGLEGRARLRRIDALDPPPGAGRFRSLISNPPYVPEREIEGLPPEVRDHEETRALDGGPDGLRVIRALAERAPRLLEPGGLLALEVGAGQAAAVRGILARAGFGSIRTVEDYNGIERVLLGRLAHP